MKTILTSIAAGSLLATLAAAQPRYSIRDLGPVDGTPGQPYLITNNGLVAGAAIASSRMHAVLWYKAQKMDIGRPGLGGPNSAAFGVNQHGQIVGQAETSVANGEDFCGFNFYGFPSSTACLPFLWQNGMMAKLPTLGGANGFANSINNRGEVAGLAETTIKDPAPGCPVSQFKPVIWRRGATQELQTYPGDTDGVAAALNDTGQAVGASGTCTSFNPNSGLYLLENHALLWESDGTPTDLGNLGGTGGIAGNHACAINNLGQAVGHSDLAGNTTFYGFFWTKETGMQPIIPLSGDFASLALGINDRSQIVGASLDASFNSRAFLWQSGAATDLNRLVTANPAGLYLLLGESINGAGQIVGLGVTTDGLHGFLATPSESEDDQ